MARPFGQTENSEKQQEKKNIQSMNSGKETNLPSRSVEEGTENSSECHGISTTDEIDGAVANVYCISNSKHVNCGPTFISVINNENKICDHLSNSIEEKCETDQKIKIKKGVLTSNRNITLEDIQIVAKDIEEDWNKLLKKLPGVTLNNFNFHQTFINAMDRGDNTNMAEIALSTWKTVLPEYSTIGNLSKTLFNIGHPDIVTYLRP